MRNNLPRECYSTVPSTGELIILKCGKKGYFQTAEDTGDKLQNQKIAEFNNHIRGISPAQVMAMRVLPILVFPAGIRSCMIPTLPFKNR